MTWRPHPGPQEEFCSRGEFEVLFGGSAGPGKTDCLIWEATRYIGHPRYKGLLLRRTFPQLQEIIDRCWQYYPLLGGVYRAGEHRWYFPSGAVISLGHMQHETDMYQYQGREYQFVGFDEVTQFTEEQYLYLFSRARSVDMDIPPRVRATTNPGGIGHMWCKRRFVDIGPPNGSYVDPRTGLTRAFVPASVNDNPTLFERDPGYIARLNALPEIERRRLLDGDWEIFEGQMFEDLRVEYHCCEPFEIPPEWPRFMVLDWGYAKPFSVGWYAIDHDDRLYRYREWYGCQEDKADTGLMMSAQEVARGILEREREPVKTRIADPAIWHKIPHFRKRETTGPSVQEDMAGQGVYFIKADNDRMQGLQQVHKRFSLIEKPREDDVIERDSRFFAFSDQVQFWRTMTAITADPKNPEDVGKWEEDHIYDEFRYACMHRPVKPQKVEQLASGSFSAERKRYLKAKKYAQRHGVSMAVAYTRVR